jgi:hypothetical protein
VSGIVNAIFTIFTQAPFTLTLERKLRGQLLLACDENVAAINCLATLVRYYSARSN